MHGRDARSGLTDGQGRLRAAWRPVIGAMQAIGPAEFAARAAALERRARFETPRAGGVPERLDPIPFPLTEDEFARLARATAARAAFLAGVVDDLYGSRAGLARGWMPAGAVFASADFIRGLASPGGLAAPRLSFCAIDLIRTAGGELRVVADHADTVPGLGLALAMRRLTAEIVPELFGRVTLASRRPLIETLQDMLHEHAAGGPIGLLAHGGADAADAALLARHLGGLLLRPDDLSCAGGQLCLRTLGGATPVRLLLRLGAARRIDPLEQGGPPSEGIPGLFRCLRTGRAVMLNAPGTGILGDAAVAAALAGVPGAPPDLDGRATADAAGDVAPCAARGAQGPADFAPASIVLRLFALRIGDGWQVLPGGLARARLADGETVLKDIWVIEDGSEAGQVPGPAQRFAPPPAHRAIHDLPGRLADDLLWLGRMTERLDAAARLLRITLPRFADASALPHEVAQRALLARCLVAAGLLSDEATGPFLSARTLHEALARERPLARLRREVRRLLDACAERFSTTMRETVAAAFEQIDAEAPSLGACLRFAATFNGAVAEDAARGGAFVFVEIGRRLERAEAMAESLAILLAAPEDRLDPGVSLGIELADATLTYEFTHAAPIGPAPAIALLLAARDYPRSLAFQTEALAAALARIGAAAEQDAARALTARLVTCAVAAEHAGPGLPAGRTDSGAPGPELLGISAGIQAIGARLNARYFAPIPPAHQVEAWE